MFYELIYTRCRQGMDITRKGQQISSDGYKVYSCTPAVMEEGKVDLQFFANAAQAKQPYNDPDFMEDAYLYYVPDFGKSFFVNFHPIPFDANAKGDYAHRPGNFVNHAIIGDFSEIYPYKMFQDDNIWDAKTRGEAYYYENPPADSGLPGRDIDDPPGHYKFEELAAFIADGRKEALAKAVAFLIAQYNEEPEKRKFLVIKDDSSKNIELWIAAIECAFSPQLASVIPFATRMDKFTSANRYTVKQGVYQQQVNLQDPNHKQRFRAMIVGLDERDKANLSSARPIASSPFVLLDGKQKQAGFEADIKNNYYELIAKFDGEHRKFCVEFLQTFKLEPNSAILELHDIFAVLNNPSQSDTRILANALDRLNKYKASNTDIFRDIYDRVNKDIPLFLKNDFSSALSIINWLLTASETVGDKGAKEGLTDIVRKAYTGIIFSKIDNTEKRTYWKQVQGTGFKADVARVISDMKIINDNLSKFKEFSPADAVTFVTVYMDSFLMIDGIDQQELKKIVRYGLIICSRNNDQNSFHEIVSSLSRVKINDKDLLFEYLKDKDDKFNDFTIKYIIDHDSAIIASDNSALAFCKKLNESGLRHLAGSALEKRVEKLNKPSEMEYFIKTLNNKDYIDEEALADVFESIDKRIGSSKDNVSSLVELLQTQRPDGAICINSAHYYAVNIFLSNLKKINLKEVMKDLIKQGFPAPDKTDENYTGKFIESILKASLQEEELKIITNFLFSAPKEFFSAYSGKLICAASKYKDKWNALINFIYESKDKQNQEDFVQALEDSKQNEKSLKSLGGLLKNEENRKFYESIIDRMKNK
jgi:hypothetical protein